MSSPNYIWRKSVTPEWLSANEPDLIEMTSGALAVIERAGHKRVLLEAPCQGAAAKRLMRAFGGKSEALPRNWLDQLLQVKAAKPIRVGKRLMVINVGGALVPRQGVAASAQSGRQGPSHILVIPAGAAFGTGEHATTAMSLRLLERVSRGLTTGWRMLDAGTGSGILALAGKRFGAGDVVAIDNDSLAIKTAKQNARANQIRGVQLLVADVARSLSGQYNIITANLYSELLISVLPKFRRGLASDGHLILSGILRSQEVGLKRALKSHGFQIHQLRRRGKWIALLVARGQKQS